MRWSAAYGLDPNIIAIIMQVESCGDPQALSSAGALGLFQVMPFHFSAGEDGFDPETNSRRGLNYFLGRMKQTGGDVGLSFAGYNGGHVAAGTTWEHWAAETQRYYVWTTGIFQDVNSNQAESETLQRWLQAGGASLCQQAAARLGL
jgi:soluble lytic murein transglycosylase-like protein